MYFPLIIHYQQLSIIMHQLYAVAHMYLHIQTKLDSGLEFFCRWSVNQSITEEQTHAPFFYDMFPLFGRSWWQPRVLENWEIGTRLHHCLAPSAWHSEMKMLHSIEAPPYSRLDFSVPLSLVVQCRSSLSICSLSWPAHTSACLQSVHTHKHTNT